MPDDNRIPTNQSQLDINASIQALNTQIAALNNLIADLGLVSITPISQEDYDALSQAEKLAGVFDIYDAVEPNIDGSRVSYTLETKDECSMRFVKKGNIVSVYGDLGSMATGANINLGVCSFKPVGSNYAIIPLFSRSAPYVQIGSIWINQQGSIEVYKPSATVQAYAFGTYIC